MANFFSNKARAAEAATNGASLSAKAPSQDSSRLQPWVEKYRPKTLDDVAAQDHTITVLQRTLQASNLPHMLFYGPPGTGKTSTILALAKQLFGPVMFPTRVLELNASDERGISIVRTKIKDFARQQLSSPPAHIKDYTQTYPCPPFKIIVLDEADSMTQDAQSALRRTMETYSRITRFCLVCNYVTRIIDPLASRCSKFRFKSLEKESARQRLGEVAQKEGVKLKGDGTEVLDALVRCAEGDLRKAITFLQSAARLVGATATAKAMNGHAKGAGEGGGGGQDAMDVDEDNGDDDDDDESGRLSAEDGVVTVETIEEIAGVIPDDIIDGLIKAMQPRPHGAAVYEGVAKAVLDMVADGWSAGQAVTQLYQSIMYDDLIASKQKNKTAGIFSEVDKRLVDGADEHLEILDLALRIAAVLEEK